MTEDLGMQCPLISIIITTYNYADMLPTALESARSQEYPNREILVLDNASTDQTPTLMMRYQTDRSIRYIRNEQNIGQVANHNKGVELAQGEYIVFLSADDLLMPGHLQTLFEYLKRHPHIDIVYTPLYSMNAAGRITARRRSELKTTYSGGRNEFAAMLAFGCDMCLPTMLVPRTIYTQYGPFDEGFTSWDYEIFVRWSANDVTFAYTAEPMAAFRSHVMQQTSIPNYFRTGKVIREFLEILQRNVTMKNAAKLRGYESSMARLCERRYQQSVLEGFVDNENMRSSVLEMSCHLKKLQTFNQTQPFIPKITVIVLANEDLFELEISLRSLINQTYTEWNAFVIQQPGMPLQSFCSLIDPQGRIQAYTMMSPGSEGDALNTAMCITSANCFSFMRSGTLFPPDHLAKVIQCFRQNTCDVTISQTILLVNDGQGNVEPIKDAFPPREYFPLISCAPSFPLDSIALKRQAVDTCYYFNEDIQHVIEWDLLVRMQLYAQCRFLDSCISIPVHLNKPYPFSDIRAVEDITKMVYGYFKTHDPKLLAIRKIFMQHLQQLQAITSNPARDSATIRQVYQTMSGVTSFTPQKSENVCLPRR